MLSFFMSTYAFPFHVTWSPKNSKLEPVTLFAQLNDPYRYTLRYYCHVLLSFTCLIRVSKHTAFHPLLVIYLTAMKYYMKFLFFICTFLSFFMLSLGHSEPTWFSQGCAWVWEAQASCFLFVAAQWEYWLWFLHFMASTYSCPCSITGVLKNLQDYIHLWLHVQTGCCQNLQDFALSVLSLFF